MESVPCSMVNGEIAPGKVTDTQSSAGSAKRGSYSLSKHPNHALRLLPCNYTHN